MTELETKVREHYGLAPAEESAVQVPKPEVEAEEE